MLPLHLCTYLSHPQVFLIPLATWTPEIIQEEDGPESFGLFTSYSMEYGALKFFGNESYEYCGPLDLNEEIVEAATKADIAQYRQFVSKPIPWVTSPAHGQPLRIDNTELGPVRQSTVDIREQEVMGIPSPLLSMEAQHLLPSSSVPHPPQLRS